MIQFFRKSYFKVHRHGNRNILFPYKNDPYKDEKHWPEGFGELNKVSKKRIYSRYFFAYLNFSLMQVGKMQTFKLGQFLRRRYGRILGEGYSPNKIYVRSTDTDRSLMSAQAELAGLFPPTANERWHENLQWQPVPIHTLPLKNDYVLSHLSECPKYDAALQKFINESPELQQIYVNHADKFEYWSRR